MIKLELTLKDVDYDTLIEQYLPLIQSHLTYSDNPVLRLLSNGMSPSMAKMVVHTLSQQQKDALVAELINHNQERLLQQMTRLLAQQGLSAEVTELVARGS